jgi:hypothetical protein
MEFQKLRLTKLGVVLVVDAAVLVAVWVVLLFFLGSSANRPIHLLLIAAAVFVAVAFWKRRPQSRIKFLPNDRTVFVAEADVRLCYGCRKELKPDQAKARCSVTATHEVHAVCADVLLRGKCPQCGNSLLPERLRAAG